MGFFSMVKEVVGCQVQLHKLLRDSDLAFYNMTGINPKGFHKDIRSLLENTCKEQWKMHDMIDYPMKTEDMTLIKLGMVCKIAQNARDEKAHDSISKALYKLSEISCFTIKPEIYQYVRSITDSPLYLG